MIHERNEEMRAFIAIILGSDENAYGCAKLFYEISGERALLLCSKPLPATSYSRILTRRVVPDFDSPAMFRRVISETLSVLKKEAEKLLLVPCSDYYSELIVNNRDICEGYVSSPILTKDCYARFSTKASFKELCEEYGVSHPKTEIVIPSGAVGERRERKYPLVLKPSNSNSFEYLHSDIADRRKVYICHDESELKRALESFVLDGYNTPAVIQEYIGGDERYYRVVNAYCDRNSKVRLIGVGRPLLEYKADSLIGNYAAVKAVRDRALCDLAADFLERIGYVGFANIDVKISPETDEYVFLELNPRQGRSSYYIRAAGENLMGAMYEDAVLGKAYSGRRYAEGDGIWINEPMSVIRREMKTRGLPLSELDGENSVRAVSLTSDFSIPRSAALLKRAVRSYIKKI